MSTSVSLMKSTQNSISSSYECVATSISNFASNKVSPFFQSIWNAVKDIFSSMNETIKNNPKTTIGILVSVVTVIGVSLAYLVLKNKKPTEKTTLNPAAALVSETPAPLNSVSVTAEDELTETTTPEASTYTDGHLDDAAVARGEGDRDDASVASHDSAASHDLVASNHSEE